MRILFLGWRGGRHGGRSISSRGFLLVVLLAVVVVLLLRCLMVAMMGMAIMSRLRIGWRCRLLKEQVGRRR